MIADSDTAFPSDGVRSNLGRSGTDGRRARRRGLEGAHGHSRSSGGPGFSSHSLNAFPYGNGQPPAAPGLRRVPVAKRTGGWRVRQRQLPSNGSSRSYFYSRTLRADNEYSVGLGDWVSFGVCCQNLPRQPGPTGHQRCQVPLTQLRQPSHLGSNTVFPGRAPAGGMASIAFANAREIGGRSDRGMLSMASV